MIDSLLRNLEQEENILKELKLYVKMPSNSNAEEKLISAAKTSLENRLRMINSSIPEILEEIFPSKKISTVTETKQLEKIKIPSDSNKSSAIVTLKKEDREKFIKESRIDLSVLNQLKNKKVELKEENVEFRGARGYVKVSNRFFLETSQRLIKQGYFPDLKNDLSKANIDVLFSSYVAMMLFSTFISIFSGIILAVVLLFFKIGITFPFFTPYDGDLIARMLRTSWIILAVPIGTFLSFYYYPSSEKGSIEKNIDQELPFAVIHMSAVSGSGIEPTEIFKIIGRSSEYPALRKEIRKVLNQLNLYGYDLITALNNVAKNTPSVKLSELFSGLSTTMTSGGDLSDFLKKRSETLLISYRLEREKFTKTAETFMDIYISLVIAAPMILMLLLVMIQISNINIGFTTGQLALMIIGAIATLNIFFIAFLHMKQPKY